MARNEWLGNALAVKQVSTITIANTWAAADTTYVECNGKRITLTVGTSAATTDVAAALKAALNGDALVNDESRNTTGNLIAEFTEFVATVSGSVVTLTGATAGVPFTVTVGETTAGSGTSTLATPTAATGPNDAANTANYSLGTIFVDGDDNVIAAPVSILYGLTALAAVAGKLLIYASFWAGGATIGLPKIRRLSGNLSYNEYRNTFLELEGCTAGSQIGIGGAVGATPTGNTLLNIDFKTGNVDLTVLRTGTTNDPSRPALCLRILPTDVADAKLEVLGGDIGVGFFGETCKVLAKVSGDARLITGTGVTHGATFDQSGGTIEINTATTAINKTGGNLTINGTGAHPIVDSFAGAVVYNSTGTLGATRITIGGTLDFSQDMTAKAIGSTILLQKGAGLLDPHGVVASLAYKPVNCRSNEVTIVGPFNKTHTLS